MARRSWLSDLSPLAGPESAGRNGQVGFEREGDLMIENGIEWPDDITLIPVHTVPNRSCKAKGRKAAVIVDFAIVDRSMAHLADYFWTRHPGGYAITKCFGKATMMHHAVVGRPLSDDVSHKNANKLDNRQENLCACSRSENELNSHDRKRRQNTSGYRGVTSDAKGRNLRKPWRGKVEVNGQTHQTGRYETAEAAATALAELRSSIGISSIGVRS